MFEHAELALPPTNQVPGDISAVMRHVMSRRNPWCDMYFIGGAWNGIKQTIGLDLEPFDRRLSEMKITVSAIKWGGGRASLCPESQAPVVDTEWRKFYPGRVESCPLFAQYNGPPEINWCRVIDLPDGLKAHRLIVAKPHGRRKILHILDDEALGTFNNEIRPAIRLLQNATPGLPKDDWLVVTLCCHW